jgi:hypothetical protein
MASDTDKDTSSKGGHFEIMVAARARVKMWMERRVDGGSSQRSLNILYKLINRHTFVYMLYVWNSRSCSRFYSRVYYTHKYNLGLRRKCCFISRPELLYVTRRRWILRLSYLQIYTTRHVQANKEFSFQTIAASPAAKNFLSFAARPEELLGNKLNLHFSRANSCRQGGNCRPLLLTSGICVVQTLHSGKWTIVKCHLYAREKLECREEGVGLNNKSVIFKSTLADIVRRESRTTTDIWLI